MTCPCPECSAFGRDPHVDPLPIDQPDDWFHDYDIEGPHFYGPFGCLLGLLAAVPLLAIIAWQSWRARRCGS